MILPVHTQQQLDQLRAGQIEPGALEQYAQQVAESVEQAAKGAPEAFEQIADLYHGQLNALQRGEVTQEQFERRYEDIRYLAESFVNESRFMLDKLSRCPEVLSPEKTDDWRRQVKCIQQVVLDRIYERPMPEGDEEKCRESLEAYKRGEGIDLREYLASLPS